MLDTLTRYLAGFTDQLFQRAVRIPLETLIDRYSSQMLTSAQLGITGAGGTTALTQAGGYTYFIAGGKLGRFGASTMPPLTGITIPAGGFNVACFFIDAASVVTTLGGTAAATPGGVVWPQFPRRQALLGFLIINANAAFTGGVSALDATTATLYVNPLGAFDPTALV